MLHIARINLERLLNGVLGATAIALAVGDAAGLYLARAATAIALVLWLALAVVPWAVSLVPSRR